MNVLLSLRPVVVAIAMVFFGILSLSQETIAAPSVMDDNFDGTSLDPARWSLLTPPSGFSVTVAETNQRLEVSIGPGAGGGGIVSRCVVAGDFDVQVDFSLLSWPPFNSHNVRLGVMDLGVVTSRPAFASSGVGIHRSSFEGEKYVMVLTDVVAQAGTSQTTGRLRLVRAGSTLSGYFHNGSDWTLVGSGASSPGEPHQTFRLER